MSQQQSDKDERTEAPTPRRREEAREKGQVPVSTELIAAVSLCAAASLFMFAGQGLAGSSAAMLRGSVTNLASLGRSDLDVPSVSRFISSSSNGVILALVAFVAPLFVLGVVAGYGQIGFRIAPKAVQLDFARLDPVKGMGRLFSARSVVRTSLAFAKILLIATTMAVVGWFQVPSLAALADADLGPSLRGLGVVVVRCTSGALVAVVVLAVLDLLFQRFQHERDLRMTKKEVREESKNTEGDPHVKARVRQVQREIASRRMMADVPNATVVITNPTHYAVALLYERGSTNGTAPTVVAKGVDHVALRIKEVAREHGIVCYEDVPLARALHAQAEIGDQIPEDLFEAVASVLAYVYRVRGEKVRA